MRSIRSVDRNAIILQLKVFKRATLKTVSIFSKQGY